MFAQTWPHSYVWASAALIHLWVCCNEKGMLVLLQTLQLMFLHSLFRSFHSLQFHKPPSACFCVRSLRCSIRLDGCGDTECDWHSGLGLHHIPRKEWGAWQPVDYATMHPFTIGDKRHEQGHHPSSLESPCVNHMQLLLYPFPAWHCCRQIKRLGGRHRGPLGEALHHVEAPRVTECIKQALTSIFNGHRAQHKSFLCSIQNTKGPPVYKAIKIILCHLAFAFVHLDNNN